MLCGNIPKWLLCSIDTRSTGGYTKFNIKPTKLILVLGVALVIFGPGKLPELGEAMGKMIREFKGAVNNIDADIKKDLGDIQNEMQEVKDAVDVRSTIQDIQNDIKESVKIDLNAAEPSNDAKTEQNEEK